MKKAKIPNDNQLLQDSRLFDLLDDNTLILLINSSNNLELLEKAENELLKRHIDFYEADQDDYSVEEDFEDFN